MIRVAATGDLHFGPDLAGTVRPHLEDLAEHADVLLIAGDVTRVGDPEEARELAKELAGLEVPVIAVLGNHDYHSDRQAEVADILEVEGIRVLEGEATTLEIDGSSLGVVGAKGFGGGFVGASGSDFGEPEMKAFIRHTREIAERLGRALSDLASEHRVALLHYAPIEATLLGERPEIYPFLGSYLLGEAIDGAGADLILHGHAHRGTERGVTPGGIPVRNVARPVIQRAYNVYCLGAGGGVSGE
ncbi:MAG TPA: metallophosphoesterase, partial [Actinomycetota bacterium]|nr:metallophosphoesterase [Actinomycetota bacterium]